MPLDPSIISSYNPTPGVDVNALMTQRMQGMANINAMERQRQADALALEDRAAAQKKAQEDAAVDALIPAYVYGIDNPTDIEGMLALVPPDMQANVAPYVDKVRGLPPEQVKSLLTSSLLSSDRGKAFLENKARERTYQVQLQQAETAAAREAREAGAEGKPKPMSASEAANLEVRKAELKIKQDEAAAKATLPEGMDAKAKAKFDQALPKAKAALRTTFSAYSNDIADVQALLADEAGINAITGAVNAYTPDITKDATRAAGLLRKIRAGNMFSALQELRINSPTGAAVGSVSNEEGRNLRDSVAALDRAQSADDFKKALTKLAVDLEIAQRNVAAAFDDTYGYRNDITSTDIETEARAIRDAAESEIGKTAPLPSALPSGVTVTRNR